MSRKTQHIIPRASGGWSVKKGGSSKATKTFTKKVDAVNYGRAISKNSKSELIIHGKDGKIQRTSSHGNDPHPPKDRDTHKK